jgi:hypothetical protein
VLNDSLAQDRTREDGTMNKAALTKHEIYNKLAGFTEKDLESIANFVDFMRHQKKLKSKKLLKLQGILKGHNIDLSDLKHFKSAAWHHVEQEFAESNADE